MTKKENLEPVIGKDEMILPRTSFFASNSKSVIDDMRKIVEKNRELEVKNNLIRNETVR